MKAEAYALSLDVDFANLAFHGTVHLRGQLDTPSLRLNAVQLQIGRAVSGSAPLTVKTLEASQEIQLDGIPAGAQEVELEFSGKVSEEALLGLYRSRQPPGYVLATQFESSGARRMFPCLDRPDQKATFDFEITVDPDLAVIFNTPASAKTSVGGKQRIRFAKTPRMSTYLVFLAIGKFDALEGKGPGTRFAVWTPPGDAEKGLFVLGVAQRAVKEFEDYYGVPFPLPKLDLVSLRDFAAGAMENWGAISSRELLLLADERTPSGLRRTIATVAAHEIAHQWFGDLVTMQWWDDIWLNESFASFMAFKVLDRLGDTPGVWTDFLLAETSGALLADSLSSTHPIRQAVESPDEIEQIFDEISYGKGASVLRMLEAFVGPEAFRQGVHDYLVKFQYGNARGEDLWAALEAAAHQPISDLMRRWVERPGHPILIVHRGPDGLHLEQRRFSVHGDHPRQYWPVPLVARTDGQPLRVLMAGPEVTLHVPADADIVLNEGALGFYRVLYDDPTYDRMLARFKQLAPSERWLINEDLFAFLLSGNASFDRWHSFIEKSIDESDPLVVHGILDQLRQLELPLYGNPVFVDLYRRFFGAQTRRLGLTSKPSETDLDRRLRDSAIRGRMLFDPEFARDLAARFPEYDHLDPDLRQAVVIAYAQVGGAPVAEELWERLREGSDADRQQIVRALGSFDDPVALAAALERGSGGEISVSLFPYALMEAAHRSRSRPVVWKWFLDRGGAFLQALSGTSTLHFVVEGLALCEGTDHPKETRQYFTEHPIAGGERGVQKGLEYADLFAGLRARLEADPAHRTSSGQ
jgi:tricorn protease interacting factor F2/3